MSVVVEACVCVCVFSPQITRERTGDEDKVLFLCFCRCVREEALLATTKNNKAERGREREQENTLSGWANSKQQQMTYDKNTQDKT